MPNSRSIYIMPFLLLISMIYIADLKYSKCACGLESGYSCVTQDLQCSPATLYFTRYGLKGKVDVTVTIDETSDMNTRGHSSPTVQEDVTPPVRNVRLPLELKTGKMFRKQGTIEHRAQVNQSLSATWQ